MNEVINQIEVDKIGSATSPLGLARTLKVVVANGTPRAGDVVVARVLTDNATYNMLELPTGRLAKVNPGDVVAGVLGRRRALKGFVGDVPVSVNKGDELYLLNLGGVIGSCSGHHSSLNDAIKVEVIGLLCDAKGTVRNIADVALPLREKLGATAPLVFCASDYVSAWGGIELFRRRGIVVDLMAGSVTDSKMGEEYVEREFGVPAGNVRRNGAKLFEIVQGKVSSFRSQVSGSLSLA